MSCEVPVIASDVAAIPEAITDGVNGFLTQAGDVDALSKSILTLLDDPILRQKMGK